VQIVDRFGTTYAVKRWPLSDDATVYYVLSLAGDAVVARAVLQVVRGCVTEVLVYHQANRRRGIESALYRLIEVDLGRPLVSEPDAIPGGPGILGQPRSRSMRLPHKTPCEGKVLTVQLGHAVPKIFAVKSSFSQVSRCFRAVRSSGVSIVKSSFPRSAASASSSCESIRSRCSR
jgi:hypothetical protein